MRGRLIDLQYSYSGKQRLVVEVDLDFSDRFEALRGAELDVNFDKHREQRTLQANSYFHVLVAKIAEEKARRGFNESNDEVKRQLVVDYGTLARDESGQAIGFKLPSSVNVDEIYPYTKCFDQREENGKLFNCYLVFKQTRTMNTSEMCRLIDGAIQVAQELDIETDTPAELEKRKAIWKEYERRNNDSD